MNTPTKDLSFGIESSTFELLCSFFSRTPEVEEVIIFGSRAKGTYREGSDIDLLIRGHNVTSTTILNLMTEVDESGILMKIDFVNANNLTDLDVLSHINRVGKLFWKR